VDSTVLGPYGTLDIEYVDAADSVNTPAKVLLPSTYRITPSTWIAPTPGSLPPAYRIRHLLVLGDSISADGQSGTQGAWRVEFITRMQSAGWPKITTVGTQQSIGVGPQEQSGLLPYQAVYSEAISGFRIANILYRDGRPNPIAAEGWDTPGLQANGDPCDTVIAPGTCIIGGSDLSFTFHIDSYVPRFSPDAAVVFLGTNDIFNAIALPDGDLTQVHVRLQAMLTRLAALMPAGAPILIVQIPPWSGGFNDSYRVTYNARIADTVIPNLAAIGIRAYAVDVSTGFNTGTMLQGDGLHPNPAGMLFVGDTIAARFLALATANNWVQ
jgi:lysophospholipase L1-like esterase